MMTDPVSDMLTRIRNAALARHERTRPGELLKKNIAEILTRRLSPTRQGERTSPSFSGRGRTSAIDGIKRVRPRAPRLRSSRSHPRVLSGKVAILHSRGVMSTEARRQKVGGELCEV
jgi:small subunit ribosomal protein S8